MSRLVWDNHGEHFYETGVSHCAYYVAQPNGTYGEGRVWNGITSISENPTGAESTDLYADNIKYLALRSAETYESTIEAYHRPDGFGVCDGVGGAYGHPVRYRRNRCPLAVTDGSDCNNGCATVE